MREFLQYAELFAPADNLALKPTSPRSSGDRALPSGGRCTGSIPVGGTLEVHHSYFHKLFAYILV